MNVQTILEQKGQNVETCTGECKVIECVQMMNQNKIGALVVVDVNNDIVGIVTERDILRAIDSRNGSVDNLSVAEIMTSKGTMIIVDKNEPVEKLMDLITNKRIRHIPITDNGKLIGIVSIGDVVKTLLEKALSENESMKNYISGI